ncbi:glycosyltransferase [uncultured Desulfobacter sp.]|uniref:glycosyltransferase n=1 Tax=uncultured Desulfobacter sp. TaxID=240139 RepID=UPI00374A3F3B
MPENIHYCEYAPFSRLFPKAAAVVHHGGIGTCAQALKAGIPQKRPRVLPKIKTLCIAHLKNRR